jgi:nucleoside-diphosphate-sugar epimerase
MNKIYIISNENFFRIFKEPNNINIYMRVVITGISSYLASELYPFLENDNEIEEVLGIDLVKPSFRSNKLKFIRKDVRDPSIKNQLNGYDAIIHLAFIVSPLKSEKEMYSINIEGSKNIFKCAIKAGISKIIHASSVAAYGSFENNPIPIIEEHPIRLMEKPYYYHETKYVVEKFLDKLEQQHPDMNIVRLRPHIFLGENINNFFQNSFQKERIYSFFPKNLTQYVWAEDVAQAFYLALKKDLAGAFNLGADNPLSSEVIAERLNKKIINVPYRPALFFMNIFYRLRIIPEADPGWLRIAKYPIIVDSSKAKKILEWKPKYDTFGTIQAFLETMKRKK